MRGEIRGMVLEMCEKQIRPRTRLGIDNGCIVETRSRIGQTTMNRVERNG